MLPFSKNIIKVKICQIFIRETWEGDLGIWLYRINNKLFVYFWEKSRYKNKEKSFGKRSQNKKLKTNQGIDKFLVVFDGLLQ